MATSYSNPGGTGDRRAFIAVTSNHWWVAGPWPGVVDGAIAGGSYMGNQAVAGHYTRFDFGDSVVIDEVTWCQSNATAQGVWQWQGSNDGTTWVGIGGSFTLGGVAVQVQAGLAGNTAAYRYYQLLGISGSSSSSPDVQEVQFKISANPAAGSSYYNPGGFGPRTGVIATAFSPGLFAAGTLARLVDGVSGQDCGFPFGAAVAGAYMQFTFPQGVVLTEITWSQTGADTHGVWKLQGSNDGASWADIASFTLGPGVLNAMAGNTTSYSIYRLLGVRGVTSYYPWLYEIWFKTGAVAANIMQGVVAVACTGAAVFAGILLCGGALTAAGRTVVAFVAGWPLEGAVAVQGVGSVQITGSQILGAAVQFVGAGSVVWLVTFGGVYIMCYTGNGTPAVPEADALSLNYVF